MVLISLWWWCFNLTGRKSYGLNVSHLFTTTAENHTLFLLIFVMIRNNVITVHVTFLFCRNISELYVSIFIVLYPDCITVVLSKCIQIGHLYIYWNVSGLSVCLSIELYPQCLFDFAPTLYFASVWYYCGIFVLVLFI